MKIKIIIVSTLLMSMNTLANEEINYNWVELNYHWNKGDVISLDGSFALSDKFYISANIDDTIIDKSYGLALGFHHSISNKTDFYTELGWKHVNPDFLENIHGASLKIGTRTSLSPKFELITMLGHQDYQGNTILRKRGIEAEVSALYKFDKHSSLKFGVQSENNDGGIIFGYRFNW